MLTNCENCSAEIEDDMVTGCDECGVDGVCEDCMGDHFCDDFDENREID